MSNGMTIADFVQQVYYAIYKVRLDVREGVEESFHSKTDKFKEVVMEGNMVLQELQKEQDWNWLRDRWEMGYTMNFGPNPQEFELPADVYKPCTGYNDAVRLHHVRYPSIVHELPWTSPRSGNTTNVAMFDEYLRHDVMDLRAMAFQVGDTITFNRKWFPEEESCLAETDVIRRMEPLHICDDDCPEHCPLAYEQKVFTEIPDPLYMVLKTAAYRAAGDPSVSERVDALTDQATKMLSAMRENDSAHTVPDVYQTSGIGFVSVY